MNVKYSSSIIRIVTFVLKPHGKQSKDEGPAHRRVESAPIVAHGEEGRRDLDAKQDTYSKKKSRWMLSIIILPFYNDYYVIV